MVADRARGDLKAVAHHVVLEGLDGERILVFSAFNATLRHGERIVREVDLLFFLVPLVEGEVDDPGEREFILVGVAQFLADAGAGIACELHELLRTAGDEEAGIAYA